MALDLVFVYGSTRGRPPGTPRHFTVTPDGAHAIFTVGDPWSRTLYRMSLDDGALAPIAALKSHAHLTYAAELGVAFVSAGERGDREAYDLTTGRLEEIGVGPETTVHGCSPDGRYLLVMGGGAPRPRVLRRVDGVPIADVAVESPTAFTGDSEHFVECRRDGGVVGVDLRTGAWTFLGTLPITYVPSHLRPERGGRRVLHLSTAGEASWIDVAARTITPIGAFGASAEIRDCRAGIALLSVADASRARVFEVRDLSTGAVFSLGRDVGVSACLVDRTRALVFNGAVFELRDFVRGEVRTWHDGIEAAPSSLAWSHDGALLAVRDVRGGVRVLRARDGAVEWTFEGPVGEPGSLCFGVDGRTLYALAPRGFVAWDLASGEEVLNRPRLKQRASSLSLSPDGRLLAAVGDGHTLRVIDLSAGPKLRISTTRDLCHPYQVRFDSMRSLGCLSVGRGAQNAHVQHAMARREPHVAQWFDLEGREIDRVALPAAEGRWIACDDDPDLWLTASAVSLVAAQRVAGQAVARDRVIRDDLEQPKVLCAANGVVLCEEGKAGARSLVVYALDDGAELGRMARARTPLFAAMAPGGARAAVAWADGGVEVFAIGR